MTTLKDVAAIMHGPPEVHCHCSLCGRADPIVRINGILPDAPDGWSTVTIDQRGQRVRSTRACPGCTGKIQALLAQLGGTR